MYLPTSVLILTATLLLFWGGVFRYAVDSGFNVYGRVYAYNFSFGLINRSQRTMKRKNFQRKNPTTKKTRRKLIQELHKGEIDASLFNSITKQDNRKS